MEETKQETRQVKDELREGARQVGSELKQKAWEATEQAKEEGRNLARRQKETVTESLNHFGAAMRKAAHQLDEDRERSMATVTEKLADQLDHATHYLRDRDFQAIYHDAEYYARRHPELIMGAMFFAGLAIGRFLKASSPYDRDWEQHPQSMPVTTTEPQIPGPTEYEPRAVGVAPSPAI